LGKKESFKQRGSKSERLYETKMGSREGGASLGFQRKGRGNSKVGDALKARILGGQL